MLVPSPEGLLTEIADEPSDVSQRMRDVADTGGSADADDGMVAGCATKVPSSTRPSSAVELCRLRFGAGNIIMEALTKYDRCSGHKSLKADRGSKWNSRDAGFNLRPADF